MYKELKINLQDTEWKYDYSDHDRNIARAIVYDESGQFYFVRANRDDDFGKATLIETAGGGVEEGKYKIRKTCSKQRITCFISCKRNDWLWCLGVQMT